MTKICLAYIHIFKLKQVFHHGIMPLRRDNEQRTAQIFI